MQTNLESYSLDGRTIALPVPRPRSSSVCRTQTTSSLRPSQELWRASEAVGCGSPAESIAWLLLASSALALLSLSFVF